MGACSAKSALRVSQEQEQRTLSGSECARESELDESVLVMDEKDFYWFLFYSEEEE